ncbi:hypothetical protein B0T18DRAFT_193204 [Schizothecium vesticola]|uniref:Uncharacterized protein n=1 Tax=Schizothecium vesticola TaxID=314040 RepID=A0AA40K2Z7_9PEZI|nr:hypothetical protein B0T18DRAFT_193204 [Schizothecium vesticola]
MAVPSSLATVLISFDSFGRLCHALQEPVNAHAGLSLTIPHRETVFRSVRLPLASTHTSRLASSPTTSAKISDIDISPTSPSSSSTALHIDSLSSPSQT